MCSVLLRLRSTEGRPAPCLASVGRYLVFLFKNVKLSTRVSAGRPAGAPDGYALAVNYDAAQDALVGAYAL